MGPGPNPHPGLASGLEINKRTALPLPMSRGFSMSTLLIELQSATVRFGALTALKDGNFALKRGDRVALVGANGSGKSTLLRAMHGLVPLADGQRVLAPTQAPRVALVFQRPFMLRLSVLANVELGL